MVHNPLQGGAPTSYKWGEITPISRVITPITHLFSAIYRGYVTPFTTIVGAHLVGGGFHLFLIFTSIWGR